MVKVKKEKGKVCVGLHAVRPYHFMAPNYRPRNFDRC